ncbi:monovalent cation/H+ antiporter subunit D [Brachymonas sp. G34]|nr:monovalent cation/H+ antiporter subunit D [Brachymonas sp. J145]MEE1652385.1 monovalent cation/H+ antiporter subunit D [Brachymonas sp. J145]
MREWIASLMPHLLVAPVLLPMLTAAIMLLLGERTSWAKRIVALVSCSLGVIIALLLLVWVRGGDGALGVGVYLPGNWQVPFGISLVADRLTAMMLLITSVIGLCAMLFAMAGWDKAGVHFYSLFQLQLMGLNGAFLTADLFNLFVFFEIMLTASYGLLLHGTGWPRVRSGMHYIAFNLMASLLFLLGAAMLYGVTGTLNMADMATKIPLIPESDRGLLHAGAALLAMAFLSKAAIWPMNFWLAPAYSAASPAVAALFAVMTKVGLYALLRLWTLLFPPSATGSELFGSEWLTWAGLLTIGFASIGLFASQRLGKLAGFSVLVSSGTLLAAFGFGQATVTGGALYYLISSTLAMSALFLVIDLIERARQEEEKVPSFDPDEEGLPFPIDMLEPPPETNLDEKEEALIGRAIPGAIAVLGVSFIMCALLIAGLPPMSGFVGKVVMLTGLINPHGMGVYGADIPVTAWVLLVMIIVSGLLATIAYSRAGIRFFWAPQDRPAPWLRVIEIVPITVLLGLCVLLIVHVGSVLRYTERTAHMLHVPTAYIDAVKATRVKPGPTSQPLPAAVPHPVPVPQQPAASVPVITPRIAPVPMPAASPPATVPPALPGASS